MYKFIDLFSGCGGLSLGLSSAGLEGQFAIERDSMAFETFSENFLSERIVPVTKFAWPSWLQRRAWAIDDLLAAHRADLQRLDGSIDVLAGGPPCQGFSFAGKRQESDPRNQLFEKYADVVETIKPRALVLENVPGMGVAHSKKEETGEKRVTATESYYDKLKRTLEELGYAVRGQVLDASRYGVPQKRSRLIVLGLRKDIAARLPGGIDRVFELLESKRIEHLRDLGLPERIWSGEAISDLRTDGAERQRCTDPLSRGPFEEAVYRGPETAYQRLMHRHCSDKSMDSMRLARHGEKVRERFAAILNECARGGNMNQASREKYGLKKQRLHPMSSSEPAPTITTLPDDVVHYAEPRILTVRESARLQSFPDWFRFRGKFTTGGAQRTKECPRYTQVGNAVPPHLGRVIGLAITAALNEATQPLVRQPSDVGQEQQQSFAIA
jgi:DNA (cytosine-5)-methyltransferase 1